MDLPCQSDFGFRARWLLPVSGAPIANAYVGGRGGRIERMERYAGQKPVLDLGDVAIIPQLVNAHTHLEFSGLSQPVAARGTPFVEWLRQVIAARASRAVNGPSDRQPSIDDGLRECENVNTILMGEICTDESVDYRRSGQTDGVCFLELMGMQDAAVAQQLARARRFLTGGPPDPPGWVRGLSPHAPYTASPGLVEACVERSRQGAVPLAMHLAESREELQWLRERQGPLQELLNERPLGKEAARQGGRSCTDYLRLLARAPRCLVVHGNYLSPEDWQLLRAHRRQMTLIYCPRTHDYFGHDAYPLPALLQAGVAVAVGTDSRASNPDLNVWHELRFIAEHYPEIAPRQILELGTIHGARALGDRRGRGRLQPGGPAHMCQLPLQGAGSDAEPYGALFSCGRDPQGILESPAR